MTDTNNYPEPSNQDYLSYYGNQKEWRPSEKGRKEYISTMSPGPAIVNLPPTLGEVHHDYSKPKAPGYKIGQRTPLNEGKKFGPGPAVYNVRTLTNKGLDICHAPRQGKANRFSNRVGTQSPGPAVYCRDPGDKMVFPHSPSFSMSKAGRKQTKIPNVPGPNTYSLPPALGPGRTPLVVGPSYSVGKAKRGGMERKCQSPGPAQYSLPSTDVFLAKGPSYYMTKRPEGFKNLTHSPGPAYYKQHLVKYDKTSCPRFTFGIRHSPFKITPGFDAEK